MQAIVTRAIGTVTLGLAFLTLGSGCGDDFNGVEPEKKFEGIQQTFEDGRIGVMIGDASDDWKPLPEVGVAFRPAAPNPTRGTTVVAMTLPTQESIKLWLESAPGRLDTVLFTGSLVAGTHAREIALGSRPDGIYRVYLTVYRGSSSYTTYGDVMLER